MSPFTSPPDAIIFNHQVWELACRIPPGRVSTYGSLAKMLPAPPGVEAKSYLSLGPRWVGSAMSKCPDDVPWQRVVNSKGAISPRPGAQEQRRLLEEEGVEFSASGRIDLTCFGWDEAGTDGQAQRLEKGD